MNRFAFKVVSIDQATRIGLVGWIIFDHLALQYAKKHLVEREVVRLRFLVRVVGDAYVFFLDGGDDVLDVHNWIIPTFQNGLFAHSPAGFQFPILAWEEFLFVEPCVHAVFGETGPFGQRADGVTVRVGMAEEYLVTEH